MFGDVALDESFGDYLCWFVLYICSNKINISTKISVCQVGYLSLQRSDVLHYLKCRIFLCVV